MTRVGRQSQKTLQKILTTKVQILLGAYRQQQEYAQFSADLSEQTKEVLRKGEIVNTLILQEPYQGIPPTVQVMLLSLVYTSFFDGKDVTFAQEKLSTIAEALAKESSFAELREMVLAEEEFDAFIRKLNAVLPYLKHHVGD